MSGDGTTDPVPRAAVPGERAAKDPAYGNRGHVPGWRGAVLSVTISALLAAAGLLIKAGQPSAPPGGSASVATAGVPGMRSTPGPSGSAAVAIPSDTRTTFIATEAVPSGATPCPGGAGTPRAAAANAITGCPLALAVRDAWRAQSPSIGASLTLQVTDPLSGEKLAIRCLGRPPIVCMGSNDRLIYLY